MHLLKILLQTILIVCIPAYVLPYIVFSLGFGRLDWFIGTNEIYATLFSITTTVIFLIMFTFMMPPIIEATFKDCNFFNEENNINNEEEDETKNNIQRTIQLYNIGQIILITAINIIMIILGNNILYGIINVGTYYIVVYILYRISKHIITISKSQTY